MIKTTLFEFLEADGVSLRGIARRLGVSHSTLHNMMTGRTPCGYVLSLAVAAWPGRIDYEGTVAESRHRCALYQAQRRLAR